MKIKGEYNPWPIIRWMVAVCIYTLTVAVAWDQFHSVSGEKEKGQKDLATAQSEITKLKSDLKRARASEAKA